MFPGLASSVTRGQISSSRCRPQSRCSLLESGQHQFGISSALEINTVALHSNLTKGPHQCTDSGAHSICAGSDAVHTSGSIEPDKIPTAAHRSGPASLKLPVTSPGPPSDREAGSFVQSRPDRLQLRR